MSNATAFRVNPGRRELARRRPSRPGAPRVECGAPPREQAAPREWKLETPPGLAWAMVQVLSARGH